MGRSFGITLSFLLVCIFTFAPFFGFGFLCNDAERRALLKFKHSFIDESNLLGSWVGKYCCNWNGVGCDSITGNVIKLDLGGIPDASTNLKAGEVNAALLELKYLTYLDLSYVYFNGSRFPDFFGSMRQLKYLNLSHTLFTGKVPHNLGNLTDLVALDLRSACLSWDPGSLEWAFRLEKLQYLDLSGINLTRAHESLSLLHHLPSLSVLNLVDCELGNSHTVTTRNSTFSYRNLQHLDLKLNNFIGPIPHFLQNFSSITYLDLSWNYFNSSIPPWLGNKVGLTYLDLSMNFFSSSIPSWLANTSYLQYLDLSSNRFTHVDGGVVSMIGHLCKLKYLSLSENQLQEEVSESHNIPRCRKYDLEHLYMANNKISGYLPIIESLSSLQSLNLWNNHLENIPSSLEGLSSLSYLRLSSNNFTSLSPIIGNMSSLQNLDLADNNFKTLPPLGGLLSLESLDLSYNNLETFPPSLGGLSSLDSLFLPYNIFKVLSPVIGNLSSLQALDLSHNNLETIPPSLGGLSSLNFLDLSCNNLNVVHQVSLTNLSILWHIDISSNSAILDLSPDWMPPFQLRSLKIKDCKLNSLIPKWILSQEQIWELDLSNSGIFGPLPANIGNAMPSLEIIQLAANQINGSIPRSLCELGGLQILDLKNNRLSGIIPDFRENSSIYIIDLSSNNISGNIPHSLAKVIHLKLLRLNNNSIEGELPLSLSNLANLELLDVGMNTLHGEIPSWINGSNFPYLNILILRENRFKGSIPQQLCSVHSLQIIDFAKNNLSGTIPQCFGYFEGMVSNSTYTKSSCDDLHAGFYCKMSYLIYDELMNAWSALEVIKGEVREYTTLLKLLTNMDLSCNHLVGVIPAEITNLSGLFSLNLSHNHLNGTIPKEIGKMESLESLDLSSNNLSGSIPKSISSLDSLSNLNMSFNNLQGQIPIDRHLQTLEDPSIYMGNPSLCGDPLPKKCHLYDIAHPPTMVVEDGDNKHEKMWFYMVIMLGFATGFWGVIAILVVHKKWRHAYFQIAEELVDWIYVKIAVRIARANQGR